MSNFATDSCHNLFQPGCTFYLHGFSGDKKTAPAELSYYGLYLLDYLRKYHPDKVSDTPFIAGREEAASETFEKERTAGSTVEAAQEEAMRVLLEGLHFSPYALLLEVVENEFSEEVQEQEREAFCREIFPHLKNLFAGYPTTDEEAYGV